MKKILSIVLIFILCLSLFACGDENNTDQTTTTTTTQNSNSPTTEAIEKGYKYTVSNGKATIIGIDYDNTFSYMEKDFVFPETLGGYPVVGIAGSTFIFAVYGSITIPSSIEFIDTPESNDTVRIGKICITDLVSWIEADISSAFITKFENIYLNGTKLNFRGDFVIPEGTKKIGKNKFNNYDTLKSVTIPDSVTSIGDQAFYHCDILSDVTIPDSVTSIGDFAFASCNKLANITIPSSVTSIGSSALYGCQNITVSSANANYSSIDGVLFDKPQTRLIQYPASKTATSYTIPSTVKIIDTFAFSLAENLTNIIIPDNVTNIGDRAFSGCYGLKDVIIPNSVTNIGVGAFHGCDNLTSVTISNNVTSIAAYTFFGCYNIKSLTIPDSVTSIGEYAIEKYSDVTIYANKGSYAYQYAEDNNIKVRPLS